jgi:hypothetical protein
MFYKLKGTNENTFVVGLNGPIIKNNSGIIEARDPTDSTYTIGRGAYPINPNDWVTKQFVEAPHATSRVTFANGTRTVEIYTVPSPTGSGRFILTRCILRLATAVVGTGTVTISIGSTSGGTQIIKPVSVTSGSTLTIIGGEAIASLGTDMSSLNAYEAIYAYNQVIYCNITVTGTITNGSIDIYIYGLLLSD